MKLATLLMLVAVGCGGPETTGSPEPSAAATDSDSTLGEPDPRYASAPTDTESVARLLRARHREDLPDRDVLLAHAEPEASLRWLVENGDPLLVRVRAASTLRFFDGAETLALLRAVFLDEALPGNLRSAAIEGTVRFPLDETLRAELEALVGADDPRIVHAAETRLTATSAPSTGP